MLKSKKTTLGLALLISSSTCIVSGSALAEKADINDMIHSELSKARESLEHGLNIEESSRKIEAINNMLENLTSKEVKMLRASSIRCLERK